MKIFECKCGSKEIFIKDSGNNKGLYCADCGKWIQWLGKDDLRLAERQIEQSIVNPIPRNLDELKEHDKQIRADVIDEFVIEIKKHHYLLCDKIIDNMDYGTFTCELEQIANELKREVE